MLNSILTDTMTMAQFLACLGMALVLGVFTAFVFLYKSRHSASFALTLSLLPMAVSMVIMLVNGNVGTGVAVAGTFALVRFRSMPGNGREISAIFTAMALGLALGMGYLGIAILFFLMVALVTLLLTAVNFGAPSRLEKSLKITLPENFNYDGLFDDIFKRYGVKVRLDKIRTTNMGTLYELTYHAWFPKETVPKAFLDELRTRNGNLGIVVGTFTAQDLL